MNTRNVSLLLAVVAMVVMAGAAQAMNTILNTGTGPTYTYQQNLNTSGDQILTDMYYNGTMQYYAYDPVYVPDGNHMGPAAAGNTVDQMMMLKFTAPSGYQIDSATINFSYVITNTGYSSGTFIAARFWSYDPGYWNPINGGTPWDYQNGTWGQTPTTLLNYTAADSAANNPTSALLWSNTTLATGGTDSVLVLFTIHPQGDDHWWDFWNTDQLFLTGGGGTPGFTATLGVSAIPEPAMLGLLLAGVVVTALKRRRS